MFFILTVCLLFNMEVLSFIGGFTVCSVSLSAEVFPKVFIYKVCFEKKVTDIA